MNLYIANQFFAGEKIGEGAFGHIYKGNKLQTHEPVAIKIESRKAKRPQLPLEAQLYRALQGISGIPTLHWFGTQGFYSILVIDLLGPSLGDIFFECGNHFSLKTVVQFAEQALLRVEHLHSKGYVHRDMKPDNFLLGWRRNCGAVSNPEMIHLIDFGLGRSYWDVSTQSHMEYSDDQKLTGTPRYASVNSHLGVEPSRRDDLESLGYIFVYFLQGWLPWQPLQARTKKELCQKIMEKKMAVSVDTLCRGLPEEFRRYLAYCRSLAYTAKPNYTYLRELFHKVAQRNGISYDYVFDWTATWSSLSPCSSSHAQTDSPKEGQHKRRETSEVRTKKNDDHRV
jgi:serine/threonine protein kinase